MRRKSRPIQILQSPARTHWKIVVDRKVIFRGTLLECLSACKENFDPTKWEVKGETII